MKNVMLFLGCFLSMGECAFATSPKTIIAGPESTVYGIAYENGISTQALISANKDRLKPPYVLYEGQVLIVPAPNEHIVGQGETPRDIADKYGVNVDVLVQENEVQQLVPGQHLSIPSRDTQPMAAALKSPTDNISTSSLAPLPSVKSVSSDRKSGARGTLGDKPVIAASHVPDSFHSVPNELAEEIAREKGTKSEVVKKDGAVSNQPVLMGNLAQRNAGAPIGSLSLPEEGKVEKPKKENKKIVQAKEKVTNKKEKQAKEEKSKEPEPRSNKEENQEAANTPQFIWPVEGTVISKFNPGKNDGVKIKISEGTPVKAAAAGEVLYAGNELKGFGNLLLLKHKGGWVTAYAHNSTLRVKKGDKVKQGQVVAESGKTGDAKEPQLHFEIRKGKQPVDPLRQLES